MQRKGSLQYQYWDFIENGNFEWHDVTAEQYVLFREISAVLLREVFPPPPGFCLDVLEAQAHGSYFPVIALGWSEKELSAQGQTLCKKLMPLLNRLVHAVDWDIIADIRRQNEP